MKHHFHPAHVPLTAALPATFALRTSALEAATTEFEWAVKRFRNSYERFSLHVASRCGFGHLSFAEVVLVHLIRMQDRPQTAALLARQLNVDGISNVQYSLRKLTKYRLITKRTSGSGKLQTYEATEKGNAFMNEYGRLRRSLLTDRTKNIDCIDARLAESTALLRMLIGVYDEAGRTAVTLPARGHAERTEMAPSET